MTPITVLLQTANQQVSITEIDRLRILLFLLWGRFLRLQCTSTRSV